MLTLDLKPIMQAKGMKKMYTTLVQAGVPVPSARKLADGSVKMLSLAHLERICLLLKCTPNDVLSWVPAEGQAVEGQPLAQLRTEEGKGLEWLADAQGMSVEELRALGEKLKEVRGGGQG